MRRVASDVKIEARAAGPWLVETAGRRFAVPADLGRRLRDGGDPEGILPLLATAPRRRGRGPALRVTLLPASCVRALAARLAPGLGDVGLVVLAAVGALLYVAASLSGPTAHVHAFAWPEAVAAVLLAGVCHELGHAGALSRGGGRPGAIGVGVLLVLPVLWCDVTEVAVLPRRARLRVDAAGVCCHLPVGGAMACVGVFWGRPAMTAAGAAVLAAVVWSLLPLLRTDGYWLLCDALGLRSLGAPAPAGAPRALRWTLAAWRTSRIVVVVAGIGVLASRLLAAWR